MNSHTLPEIDQKRIALRRQGVKHQRSFDLQMEHHCAACEKPLRPGSMVYHNSDCSVFMHFYGTDCVIDHNLTPQQRGYLAQITGGKRRVERVELSAPGQFKTKVKEPEPMPSWVDGICTVTPDGQVILPNQPVIPIPTCPLLPAQIHFPVEIMPDTRPFLAVINQQWQEAHGLVVPHVGTNPLAWTINKKPPDKPCFRVVSRPLFNGSSKTLYDVRDRQDHIIQSSPRLEIAQRVAEYHNQHYAQQ